MSCYEKWSLIIGAVGAIATFSAVLVALWQTKYANKKRIKLKVYESQLAFSPDIQNSETRYLRLNICNIGNREVLIKTKTLKLGDISFSFLPTGRLDLWQDLYKNLTNEVKLGVEEYVDINFPIKTLLPKLKELCNDNKKLINKRLNFIITDATGKTFKTQSKHKVKELIERYSNS